MFESTLDCYSLLAGNVRIIAPRKRKVQMAFLTDLHLVFLGVFTIMVLE